jgi:hypothetical protein
MEETMTQQDEVRNWAIRKSEENPGSFVRSIVQAILAADAENAEILLPVALLFMAKYPNHEL